MVILRQLKTIYTQRWHSIQHDGKNAGNNFKTKEVVIRYCRENEFPALETVVKCA